MTTEPSGQVRPSVGRTLVEAAVALALFAAVAAAGLWPQVLGLNAAVVQAIQSAFPPGSADAVSILLVLGSSQVSLVLLLVLGVWLYRRGERLTALCLGMVLVGIVVELVLKATLLHPMVWPELSRGSGLYPFPELKPPAGLDLVSPFPSGHMFRATFVALAVAGAAEPLLPRRSTLVLRAAAVVLLSGIAFGVLYLGWHWPTDVLGSLALGFALTAPTRYLARLEAAGTYRY